MIIHNIKISEEVIAVCVKRMRNGGTFTAKTIETLARREGVPNTHNNDAIAMRFADRLIQRERKDGEIVRDGRGWRAV